MQRFGWTTFGLVLSMVWFAGCGGGAPKDRPSDCTDQEFYNSQTKRCTSCPAIDPPECARGCDYVVEEDDRGCPTARCGEGCRQCPVGESYSTTTGLCESCPEAPDCESMSCQGEIRLEEGEGRACPGAEAYACGQCLEPEKGCTADDETGECVDRDE